MTNNVGILLTNTGTPDDATISAIRRYLREFLSDPRIIQLPRAFWLPILYGFVLPLRPRYVTHYYQKIWTEHGSPMQNNMQQIAHKLSAHLKTPVEIGMNYGNPSIERALSELQKKDIKKIIALPLFPQYSNTTTRSSYDRIINALKSFRILPLISFVNSYAEHTAYINALAESIQSYWKRFGRAQHLLISFHGIPKSYVTKGDPYDKECQKSANLLASALNLSAPDWTLCYQSRFGYNKWLGPSTQDMLAALPKRGLKNINIVCPGFACDCLETLEEIVIRGKKIFMNAGGESLQYIPALNNNDEHIVALVNIISENYI